jgi:hypothetical protein
MARVVESVVPEFEDAVHVEKVITTKLEGGLRYKEISKDLGRPAPVPSIFIEGELVYDQTPGQEELKAYLEKCITSAS